MNSDKEKRLCRLGSQLAQLQDELCKQQGPWRFENGCRRFLDQSESQEATGFVQFKRLFPIAVGICGLACFYLFWVNTIAPSPLAYTVGPNAHDAQIGQWIYAPQTEKRTISFSDGTIVELNKKTQARIDAVRDDGADLLLQSGSATFHVVPKASHDWRVAVGPFQVRVTGTVFKVSWNPSDQHLEIDLHRGSVSVTGPLWQKEKRIRKGQRLQVSIPQNKVALTDISASSKQPAHRHHLTVNPLPRIDRSAIPARTAGASEKKTDQKLPKLAKSRTPTGIQKGERKPKGDDRTEIEGTVRWKQLADQGKYREALLHIGERNFITLCRNAAAEDLLRLSDVARFAGKLQYSKKALLSLRSRFPNTGEAALAAYTLGRTSFEQESNFTQAARWFGEYIKEQPNGPLIGEAMGRRMEAQQKAGLHAEAKMSATRYLEEFPKGPHADIAKRLSREQP